MLEPWIIEQIRRREQEERRRNERPQLEIPTSDRSGDPTWRRREGDSPNPRDEQDRDQDERDRDQGERGERGERGRKQDEPERGVMIIDFGVC